MTTNKQADVQTLPVPGMRVEHLLHAPQTAEATASAMIAEGLVEELRGKVPVLYSTASRRAELDGIKRAIIPWFATYPQPDRDDADWMLFWHGYVVASGHQPEAAIVGAMEAWAKFPDSEFLPKPGRLAELAAKTPTAAFKLAGRAHQALQLVDDMQDRQRIDANMARDQVKPPEQVEAVRNLLADFENKSKPVRETQRRILQRGSAAAHREPAYSGGVPAPGSALTAEMLRLLGRPIPDPASVTQEFT